MTGLFTRTAFFSDICEVMRLFIDARRIERLEDDNIICGGCCIFHYLSEAGGLIRSTSKVTVGGKTVAEYNYEVFSGNGTLERKRIAKRASKICVYRALSKYSGKRMPWGSLTGIRPTKLLRDSETLLGEEGAKALFLNEFDVSLKKYEIAEKIADIQRPLMPDSNDIDVYIGIPFCTTRCAYCSFASNTPDVFSGAEGKYVSALLRELSDADQFLYGKKVRSVYIGGGTPTALSDIHLKEILSRAKQIASGAKEFTVEAGRPDTITKEKLRLIKDAGANRLSVNAQTLKDETLARIGRRHTAADFHNAYIMSKKAGFDINVDMIAGLPGEDEADFESTLGSIIGLSPENITVHTLAIKRASRFADENMDAFPADSETARMIDAAQAMLEGAGYRPYYMYRQKYMKGSLENAGYSKSGSECLYNIDNMEELCSVAAFGAGAISKRICSGGERIERAANIKDLKLYIENLDKMIERKRALFS